MSRLGLAVHRFRPDALEVAGRVISWAGSNGYEVVVDESDLASLRTISVTSGDVGDVDVLVSIGGDGTMLRSVHALNGRTVPLIGVNLGQLGYLAVVEDDEVIEALDVWHNGTEGTEYHYDDRMLLEVSMWAKGLD